MKSAGIAIGYGLVTALAVAVPFIPQRPVPMREPLAAVRAVDKEPADAGSFFDQPAEKAYKNIVIFKGKTAGEVMGAMRFMNVALGVNCEYCHNHDDFSSDVKPEKAMARSMYYMTEKINNQEFSSPEVTCYTCHGGRRHPLTAPNIPDGAVPAGVVAERWAIKPAPVGTTLAAVTDAYLAALGGKDAVRRIVSRRLVGTRTEKDGSGPIEVVLRAPGSGAVTTVRRGEHPGTLITGTNGKEAWATLSGNEPRDLYSEDLEQIRRMAEAVPALDLASRIPDLSVWGREPRPDGGESIVIGGTTRAGAHERLYFDAVTGLLLKRYVEVPTILGYLHFTMEYDDYRKVGGVMTPHTIRWRTPRRSWTDTFATIENNVSVPDAILARPVPAQKR